ncbi:hypothetical protein D3C84_199760 [compost metagenome]
MARHHRHDRQRVEDAAVHQHAVALHHRGEQAGNRRRGAHGLVQAAFLEPDFLLVGQVGGNGGVGDAQVFDVDLADDLADLPEDLLASDSAQAEADIHQAQHVQVIQAFDPVAVIVELAGSIDATNHGPHGATGDTGDVVAAPFDFLDNANVGIAPGTARPQHQCDSFLHERVPDCCPLSMHHHYRGYRAGVGFMALKGCWRFATASACATLESGRAGHFFL